MTEVGINPALRAKVLNGAGLLAYYQNHFDQAKSRLEECLALQSHLNERDIAYAEMTLAYVVHDQFDFNCASLLYMEALERFRRLDDSYGIIVRGVGSYFYRFVLTCTGEIRAERINGGTRLPIHEQVPSGDAPRPPGEVRIGMWAVGSEMRLFLNGRFQFSVSEPTFPSGGFGVFARSTGNDPVSVTFSDFKVYDVDYVPPTKTPIPTPKP